MIAIIVTYHSAPYTSVASYLTGDYQMSQALCDAFELLFSGIATPRLAITIQGLQPGIDPSI